MAGTASKDLPDLPDELLSRWPPPDQLPLTLDWGAMTCEQRHRWLIKRAYRQTDDGWVARVDRGDDETAQQVIQAVTTNAGAEMLAAQIYLDAAKPALDEAEVAGGFDPFTGNREADEELEGHIWAWYFVAVALIVAIVIGALLTDMFGLRAGSDDDAGRPAPVAGDVDEGDPQPEQAGTDGSGDQTPAVADVIEQEAADEAADEGPAAADDADDGPAIAAGSITFSSLPEHEAYVETWSDGEIGITLGSDGSYTYVSSGVRQTGSFRMTREDGVDRILFVDPDDPSGLTVTSQIPVSIVDGALVYGHGDAARRLEAVPALPVIEVEYPPAQRLDLGTVEPEGGWWSEHDGLHWSPTSTSGVSFSATPVTMTGGIDIDIEAGTIAASGTAAFVCDAGRCVNVEGDAGTGTATFAIDSGTRSGRPGRWVYEGTAAVELQWQSIFGCSTGVCEWSYTTDVAMPYRVVISDDSGSSFVTFELTSGTVADGQRFSIRMSATPDVVAS